ncbi:calcium-binding protein [Albimonas pacifica]|uniref:Hemolysin-type calcium-binding repeat-containing protein n=1 Tax=Albimonas pacifica TaxID=1114924 RepID=A0A1I3NRP5_9RHOB|nr:calcium-binding protein [Albimonas pacifica]SFJ11945.1 Hemolysin-type calcium-binding repeat-containing protein [Albimonas pacifica]
MARLTVTGDDDADLLYLSAGFGRDGAGELSDDSATARYEWTTAAGRAATAIGPSGAISVNLSDRPSGRAETLTLAVTEGTTLSVEADRPSIRVGLLAGDGPPGAAFDHMLAREDRFRVDGAGDVRLFGDAVMAVDGDRGRADVFLFAGTGGRQAAGDFWLVPATVFQVRMGDDDLRIESRGAVQVWGDVASTVDKVDYDAALLRAGDDRLDARDALEGVRRPDAPVLVGDVGHLGRGWLLRGGDDLLIAPREAAGALAGDVLLADGLSRLYCGDDVLRGGRGDDLLFGDVQDVLEPRLHLRPGADLLRGGRGDDALYGDAREDGPETVLLGPRAAGGDRLYGGAGRDLAQGGWGDDRVFGGGGRDRLHGEHGDDRIRGDGGADRLWGGRGNDRLEGGGDDDRLLGAAGNDRLFGGAGADLLHGGAGRDRLAGGEGADRFLLRGGGGRDVAVDFDPARDWLSAPRGLGPMQVEETARGMLISVRGASMLLLGVDERELDRADPDWLG